MSATSFSKTDVRYWKARVFKHQRNGEDDLDYSAKIQYGGQRRRVPLKTPNREAAAAKAVHFYRLVCSQGWDAAFAWLNPEQEVAKNRKPDITVGEILEVAETRAIHVRPRTLAFYATCLRQVVADIVSAKRCKKRFDPVKGGARAWRAQVIATPLSRLTPESLRGWQTQYIRRAGDNPLARKRAMTSANSILGNASRLFSTRMLPHYADAGLAVEENPFRAVKAFPKQDARYLSKIDPEIMLRWARSELASGNEDEKMVYRIIVISLVLGLRRSEIDRLQWSHVDFQRASVRIESTGEGLVKGLGSVREVDLEEQIVLLFRSWKAEARSVYVIECSNPSKPGAGYQHYRCDRILDAATDWVRGHGLEGEHHPLHTLRKECGSMLAKRHGIHAAAESLGHRDIRICAEYYVTRKERVTAGLGSALMVEEPPTSNSSIAL